MENKMVGGSDPLTGVLVQGFLGDERNYCTGSGLFFAMKKQNLNCFVSNIE